MNENVYEALTDPEGMEPEEYVAAYQALIDSGQAWLLEGSVGRTAMNLIEDGRCMLGEQAHRDYWGNRVPSRHEIEPGAPGSSEYVKNREEN